MLATMTIEVYTYIATEQQVNKSDSDFFVIFKKNFFQIF